MSLSQFAPPEAWCLVVVFLLFPGRSPSTMSNSGYRRLTATPVKTSTSSWLGTSVTWQQRRWWITQQQRWSFLDASTCRGWCCLFHGAMGGNFRDRNNIRLFKQPKLICLQKCITCKSASQKMYLPKSSGHFFSLNVPEMIIYLLLGLKIIKRTKLFTSNCRKEDWLNATSCWCFNCTAGTWSSIQNADGTIRSLIFAL